MEQAQRTNIIILDACRDNPLARSLARSMGTRSTAIGRGLAPMTAGIGTLIVYATAPGHQALDGEGKNSPFTAALLKHIATPKLEIRDVFTRVRQDVFEATKMRPQPQIPWDTSSLMASVYLAAAPDAPATPPGVTPPAPAPAPPPSAADNEALFWQSIKDSKNAADFKDYLARWPTGTFAELAKRRISEIEKAVDVTPSAPERPAPVRPSPPTPQRRVSTIERGVFLNGSAVAIAGVDNRVATAQACQALCIANGQCSAWSYLDDTFSEASQRRFCFGFAKVERRSKLNGSVSGVIRTTPAAPPGTTSAKPGQRTSTFEVGIYRAPNTIAEGTVESSARTARECQSRCVQSSDCVAWNFSHETMTNMPNYCILLQKPAAARKNDQFTSGVIRTTPAAAPAPKPVTPGPAMQMDRQAFIQELIRRARARAREDGLCARFHGYEGLTPYAVFATKAEGSFIVWGGASGCTVTQVGASFSHPKDGSACRRINEFDCWPGQICLVTSDPARCQDKRNSSEWPLSKGQ
jgi:hypothetical protein